MSLGANDAPLPPVRPRPKCNFIHPRQLSPFLHRLVLPFSNDEILSSYEEFDSSGTDLVTSCVKMSEHEILVQHMVDIEKATAEFREAVRKETSYLFSHEQFQKTLCDAFDCAKETQHLQLEPWTPSAKRRCLRTTNCRKVACHYLARTPPGASHLGRGGRVPLGVGGGPRALYRAMMRSTYIR